MRCGFRVIVMTCATSGRGCLCFRLCFIGTTARIYHDIPRVQLISRYARLQAIFCMIQKMLPRLGCASSGFVADVQILLRLDIWCRMANQIQETHRKRPQHGTICWEGQFASCDPALLCSSGDCQGPPQASGTSP